MSKEIEKMSDSFLKGRGICISVNQGSGGYGHDISVNGSRHKKVVTGKAGNQYPVAKRRGVR